VWHGWVTHCTRRVVAWTWCVCVLSAAQSCTPRKGKGHCRRMPSSQRLLRPLLSMAKGTPR
jgi:hypothetical protein